MADASADIGEDIYIAQFANSLAERVIFRQPIAILQRKFYST